VNDSCSLAASSAREMVLVIPTLLLGSHSGIRLGKGGSHLIWCMV